MTLESRPGIETQTLRARVQIGGTPRAFPFGAPGRGDGQLAAAPAASYDLAKARHVEGFRRGRRLSARSVFPLLGGLMLGSRGGGLVLVAPLSILPVRHSSLIIRPFLTELDATLSVAGVGSARRHPPPSPMCVHR